jgi:hypothetical protein
MIPAVPMSSESLTVNEYDPAIVGVPEMTPVEELRLTPSGSNPVDTA